jgi:hypothetical protein
MASPEAALVAALKANAGVISAAGGRVFIAGGRQGSAYPYVTIQRITTAGAAHLDGPSNLDWPLFQIDSWGEDALSALNTSEAIRTAIDGVSITSTAPNFYAVFQDQRGPAPDEETRTFRVSQDFHIYHERI